MAVGYESLVEVEITQKDIDNAVAVFNAATVDSYLWKSYYCFNISRNCPIAQALIRLGYEPEVGTITWVCAADKKHYLLKEGADYFINKVPSQWRELQPRMVTIEVPA